MHTECAEVGTNLRKYRFYIGQGIPDPWIIHPQMYSSKFFSPGDFKEVKKHRKHSDCSRGPCICCQKEYLFECPDKCASKYCSYTDGNSKNTIPAPHSDDKCKCNEGFPNRAETSSNESCSETENEAENLNEEFKTPPLCECFVSRKTFSSCSEKSGCTNAEYCEKPFKSNRNYKPVKGSRKICFCPFVRQLCIRRPSENEEDKSSPERKTVVSKEIQTDALVIKNSKTVQTEKPAAKAQQPKCTCANKYLTYNYNYNAHKQCSRKGCQPIYSIPNVCCTSGFIHNPPIACPYSFMNHFTIHKCDRHDNGEVKKHRRKKKHHKERENEEDSDAEDDINQTMANAEENSVPKGRTKWEYVEREPPETPRNTSNNSKDSQQQKAFGHYKYINDDKLKNYLQGNSQFSFTKPVYSGSKFFGFPEGDSLLQNAGFEKFKTFSHNKPFESSYLESKMKLRGNYLHASTIKPSFYSDQSPFGLTEMRSQKNGMITKPEEATDYDDRRSLIRSQTNFTKALRKRRKFLANEKRRKLASHRKPTFSEHQSSSNKHPVTIVEKGIQAEETSQDYVNLEKIFHAENFNSSSGFLNFDKNSQTRVKDFTFSAK